MSESLRERVRALVAGDISDHAVWMGNAAGMLMELLRAHEDAVRARHSDAVANTEDIKLLKLAHEAEVRSAYERGYQEGLDDERI